MEKNNYTIITIGGAGTGKSTLCNFLVDGDDKQQRFKSSKTTNGGET